MTQPPATPEAGPRLATGWDGQLRYPNPIHYTSMSADLIAGLRVAADKWAQGWQARLDSWDDTQLDPAKEHDAHEIIVALLQQLAPQDGHASPNAHG